MEKQIVVEPISTAIAVKAQEEAPVMLKKAEAIVIFNQDQYEGANGVLRAVKDKFKDLDSKRKTITKPLDEAKKAVMDLFRSPLEILAKAESIIKGAMITYSEEQERLRIAEQRKLELKAKAEEDRKRKELEARAEKWAAKGNEAKAEELQEQAEDVRVEAPVVAPKMEQAKGVSVSDKYSAIIINKSLIPREHWILNLPGLNKIGQASKGIMKIPGVKWKCEKVLASRM